MELKELTEKTLTLFNSNNTTEIIKKLPAKIHGGHTLLSLVWQKYSSNLSLSYCPR